MSTANPLAWAASQCPRCWGYGRIRTRAGPQVCPCVHRRIARARGALQSDWERLAFDAQLHPDTFPPHPCLRSSLAMRMIERQSPRR